MAALIPGQAGPDGLPGLGGLDTDEFWQELDARAPPMLRFGLRASVWTLTWLPAARSLRPFHRLGPEARERFVQRAARSDSYVIRQAITTLKVMACFAYLRDSSVRERLS